MAVLLAVLFIGISFLAVNFGDHAASRADHRPSSRRSPARVYGDGTIPFFLFQAFTALLLFLAANTSLHRVPPPGGDPRRGRLHAAPVRLPRRPARVLAGASSSLGGRRRALWSLFRGETHLLIPLYAVGVFIDFTISQAGMIRHWLRERPPGWRRRLAINAFGCVLTARRRRSS